MVIRLLGPPEVLRQDRPLTIKRRKSRALLYYLAAQTDPMSREHLLAFFWPDHNRSAARHSLRSSLYNLRQAIGGALLADNDRLTFSADTQIDVRSFARGLSQADASISELITPLNLARGDFLAGFSVPDLPEYDDWVAIERERYRRLAVKGLTTLSHLHEANGDISAALEALERALGFDPLQEDLQRACLRLLHLSGDRIGAIRRYEQFRKLLDDEMGVPPMAETRAVYDSIVSDDFSQLAASLETVNLSPRLEQHQIAPDGLSRILPFVGRQLELKDMEAGHNSRQLVLLEGESGIGKTRLIETYLQSVQKRTPGTLILTGRARELEHTLPYQPVIEAIRVLLSHSAWPLLEARLALPTIWQTEIGRLLPELAQTPTNSPLPAHSTANESRLWEGINQFLRAVSQQRRLVIALDDLHWADRSTLGLLGYLVRQTNQAPAPIDFLATTRPMSPRLPIFVLQQSLLRENQLQQLRLDRLSEEDVMALAGRLSPDFARSLGRWLYQGSEGNPFILNELVRYARDEHILSADHTVNLKLLPTAPVVPQTVYAMIQSRLNRLSELARRVLEAAVVVGREFDYEVVARAAALSDRAAIEALEECQRAELIFPLNDNRYGIDHNLSMEVVHQEISKPRYRLLNRHVAEALEKIHHERLDVVAGKIAQHFDAGGLPKQATKYALLAGERATKLAAWQEAVNFYEQALIGVESNDRLAVLLSLGHAYLLAGQIVQATEFLREALTMARVQNDTAVENMAMQILAESLLMQDYHEDVIVLAREMLSLNRPEMTAIAHALLGAALSLEGVDLVEAETQLRLAESNLRKQPELSNPALLAEVKFELGNIYARQGNLENAVDQYKATLELTGSIDTDVAWRWHILAHNNLAYHLHLIGDPQAVQYGQMGLALAREKGVITLLPYLLSTLGEIALAQDDLDTAESYFREGLALAEQFAHPERTVGLSANLGLLALRRGQMAMAVHRLSTALGQAEAINNHYQATQIRLWLAPLLPPKEGRILLLEALTLSQGSGYGRLLEEARQLEQQIVAD